MNRFGQFCRTSYDDEDDIYSEKVRQTTDPLQYVMNTNKIYNNNSCTSTFGPRPGHMGYGASLVENSPPALSQAGEITNVESILTNRNMKLSKSMKSGVNKIDVTKYNVTNPRICNDYLNPMSSRLSYPPSNYRDMGINRFYDLLHPPQDNIFVDFSVNTRLETTDNFFGNDSEMLNNDDSLPHAESKQETCNTYSYCPRM